MSEITYSHTRGKDVEWSLKDYDYNQEEMGPTGATLIGIQQGAFEADWTE